MVSRIIVALVLCASLTASAQQTAIHYDIYQDYKRGVELYQTEMYAAAQKHFDMTVNQSKDLLDDQMHTYYINASFYQAACAMELDNPGGAEAMIEFMEKNGDNPKYTVGAYYLGKHYYSKRQYDKAIEWYKEADQTSLSGRQREEMQFQLAYS